MIRSIGVVAGCLWALALATAFADGVGEQNYNYVHPPTYLKTSNTQPSGGSGTILFQHGQSMTGNVTTGDTQVGINFDSGAFPPVSGQTGVRVDILPLAKYPRLPAKSILDGNAYAFRALYIPSGRPVTHLQARALVTLVYPRTPVAFLGLMNGHWHAVCPFTRALRTAATVSCYERSLAPEIAVLRTHKPLPSQTGSRIIALALGIMTAFVIVGILSWVIWKNFIRKQPPSTR